MINSSVVMVEPWHIDHVSKNAREADRQEVLAASGEDVKTILEKGVRFSTACWTLIVEDEPVAIGGVTALNLLAGEGIPWILGTDAVLKHPLSFMKASRKYLAEVLRYYSYLVNYVDVRNEMAIKYLTRMGFEILEPAPFGKEGLPFRKFEMRIDHV